jgi:hypothetical protein
MKILICLNFLKLIYFLIVLSILYYINSQSMILNVYEILGVNSKKWPGSREAAGHLS